MRKIIASGVLFLGVAQAAVTPRQVVNQIASDMNVVQQGSAACNDWASANADYSYPKLSLSSDKYITTFSFAYRDSPGLTSIKPLFELAAMNNDLDSDSAWSTAGGLLARTYRSDQTPGYKYAVSLSERLSDSNPYLKTVDVCVSVLALRKS